MPRITKVKEIPPERIFLQWLDPEADYAESWEVTWCQDAIDKTDPEYVRKDLYDALQKRVDNLLEAIKAGRVGYTHDGLKVYTANFLARGIDDAQV